MRAFYRDVVKQQQIGPLFILAHSMGGLIATRWLAETPEDRAGTKAMILTSPAFMIGVPPLSLPISRGLAALGRGTYYAGGQHDYNNRDRRFVHNMLSHDRGRFGVTEKYFDANPDLRTGGVTWGWLAAALKAMKQLQKPGTLARIDTPALALFGTRDIITPPAKIIPLIRQMPHAEIFAIRGAWHDLMNEADLYRDQAWRHIDRFLGAIRR
jgi:lysophospholipase